jgi:hypothetical protein
MRSSIFAVALVAAVVSAGSPRHQTHPAANPGITSGMGPNMKAMLDIMSEPMAGEPFDKAYLAELEDCFTTLAPGLSHTSDRVWQAFLNFSQTDGSSHRQGRSSQADDWTPKKGCSLLCSLPAIDMHALPSSSAQVVPGRLKVGTGKSTSNATTPPLVAQRTSPYASRATLFPTSPSTVARPASAPRTRPVRSQICQPPSRRLRSKGSLRKPPAVHSCMARRPPSAHSSTPEGSLSSPSSRTR